jgi:hypothetical protein
MPSTRAWLREYGARVFGIDLRALAAFRIALGLTLLGYVGMVSLDYELLWTGRGVLPARAVWPSESSGMLTASMLHPLADSPAFVLGLLAAMAGAAVLLVAGRFTLGATLCLWVGVSFLVRRNPYVSNASQSMTLFCLLWALFLPLGAQGWPGRRRASGQLPLQLVSPATLGLVVQILFVYVTAALAKRGPEWHADATAIALVAGQERYQTLFTPLLAALPTPALAALTHGVWYTEALAPLFLISPVAFAPMRTAGTLLLMALHVGLGVFTRLGIFPWICLSYLIVLLPRAFWDRVLPWTAAAGARAEAAPRRPGRSAAHALAAVLVACTLANYLRLVPGLEGNAPAWMRRLAGPLHLGQIYRLFSQLGPFNPRYLVLGRRADGSLVDLQSLAPAEPLWEAARISVAPDGSGRFPWVQYTGLLGEPGFPHKAQAPHLAAFYCRALAQGAVPLEQVEIYHLARRTDLAARPTLTRLAFALPCLEPLP